MQKREFLNYIHYFRGLAILFIVGLHAAVTLIWDDRFLQRKALIVLFNNGTVLFVFIAGYLFYHLNKNKFNYFDYLKKKFLYVILPYLFVSIPALFDKFYFSKVGDHWWMNHEFVEHSTVAKVFFLLLTGRHMGVFWFIPMISVVYIFAPLILKFAKTQLFLYLVPVLVVLGLFTFRFGYYANIALSLEYFVPVYLFGIWVYRLKDFIFGHAKAFLIILGVAFVAITLAEFFEWLPFSETISLRDVKYTIYRFNWNKFKMHIFCVGALVYFFQQPEANYSFLKLMGDYSFGVFFVHLYVIQVFRLLDRGGYLRISPPNVIIFIAYFAVVVLITLGLVKLVRVVMKDKSRYFVGS